MVNIRIPLNFFHDRRRVKNAQKTQLESKARYKSVLDIPFDAYDQTTKLPATIVVGTHEIAPLVSIQEVKDHLTFLSALHNFREVAADFPALCLASARDYVKWARDLQQPPISTQLTVEELPSLGVLMCWHTHMLNPLIYARDVVAYRGLEGLEFPLSEVAQAIRRGTMDISQPLVSCDDVGEDPPGVWTAVDLAEAVQRQAKFIANMDRIGFLKMDGDKQLREVQVSIVLYHAWLDLMHSLENRIFLVPRLDIDLAWHTHQLHAASYRQDTIELLGRTLDHNDNAGDGKIGDGLKDTARLWKERYGYDYQ